jgi:hypothetical protein
MVVAVAAVAVVVVVVAVVVVVVVDRNFAWCQGLREPSSVLTPKRERVLRQTSGARDYPLVAVATF